MITQNIWQPALLRVGMRTCGPAHRLALGSKKSTERAGWDRANPDRRQNRFKTLNEKAKQNTVNMQGEMCFSFGEGGQRERRQTNQRNLHEGVNIVNQSQKII